MLARTIYPKPILIVEGYFALYNDVLNRHYARKYYLDLEDSVRNIRRDKTDIIGDSHYEQLILNPMHKQFIEPTKAHADVILDVSKLSVNEVQRTLRNDIAAHID